jgi:transcription termination factor NusB
MNRTLKRPMFRMGGAADGITSGLDRPRQQYNQAGMVDKQKEVSDAALNFIVDKARERGQFTDDINIQAMGNKATGDMSQEQAIAEALARAKQFSGSQEPMSGREMAARFLIPFGLNFATRPPSGGLLSTAAGAAKDPVDMLIKGIDQRRDAKTEREADLFGALLSSNLQGIREDKKIAAQELKDSKELLTLYDRTLEKNVIVQAGDVYKNLANYGPAEADKQGRTFEKLEVANLIEQKMAEIFELEAKEDKSAEDLQEIEKAKGVLEYLQGNKNTNAFTTALLKDPEYQKKLRRSIRAKLETTDKYSGTLDATKELQLKQEIDSALKFYIENLKFPPELQLAKGGRVEYNVGGDVNMSAEPSQKIDYETLRARLPREITDDIVKLIASSPEALEDFATIQTQQDVVLFNQKYDVELVLPAEA